MVVVWQAPVRKQCQRAASPHVLIFQIDNIEKHPCTAPCTDSFVRVLSPDVWKARRRSWCRRARTIDNKPVQPTTKRYDTILFLGVRNDRQCAPRSNGWDAGSARDWCLGVASVDTHIAYNGPVTLSSFLFDLVTVHQNLKCAPTRPTTPRRLALKVASSVSSDEGRTQTCGPPHLLCAFEMVLPAQVAHAGARRREPARIDRIHSLTTMIGGGTLVRACVLCLACPKLVSGGIRALEADGHARVARMTPAACPLTFPC